MIDDREAASLDGGADDHALMQAYAAGDPAAFDALYARHKGPVYRFFLRQLDPAEARSVTRRSGSR